LVYVIIPKNSNIRTVIHSQTVPRHKFHFNEKILVIIIESLVYDVRGRGEHKRKQLIISICIQCMYATTVALQWIIDNSHRAADMSPLIQYAIISMISGSVVALVSMVVVLDTALPNQLPTALGPASKLVTLGM